MTEPRTHGNKHNYHKTESDFVATGPSLKMLSPRNGGIWQICDSLTRQRHYFSSFCIFIIEIQSLLVQILLFLQSILIVNFVFPESRRCCLGYASAAFRFVEEGRGAVLLERSQTC